MLSAGGGFSVTISAVDAITRPLNQINRNFERLSRSLGVERGGRGPGRGPDWFGAANFFGIRGHRDFEKAIYSATRESRDLGRHLSLAFQPLQALAGLPTAAAFNLNTVTAAITDFAKAGMSLRRVSIAAGVPEKTLYDIGNAARLLGIDYNAAVQGATALNQTLYEVRTRPELYPLRYQILNQPQIAVRYATVPLETTLADINAIMQRLTPQAQQQWFAGVEPALRALQPLLTLPPDQFRKTLEQAQRMSPFDPKYSEKAEAFARAQGAAGVAARQLGTLLMKDLHAALQKPLEDFTALLNVITKTPAAMNALEVGLLSLSAVLGVTFATAMLQAAASLASFFVLPALTAAAVLFFVPDKFLTPEMAQLRQFAVGQLGEFAKWVAGGGAGVGPGGIGGMPRHGGVPGPTAPVVPLPQTLGESIARAEGTWENGRINYSALFGGGIYGKPPKPIEQMTVDEVIAFQGQMLANPENWRRTSAVGGYQIIRSNLIAMREAGYLRGDEIYGPAVQDRARDWIWARQGSYAWEGYKQYPELRRQAETLAAQARGVADRPVSPTMASLLGRVGQENDVTFQVTSGIRAGGSLRHDPSITGLGAADVIVRDRQTGRVLLPGNAADAARLQQVAESAYRAGATGIGAGAGYMSGAEMHIGGAGRSNFPYWGTGERAAGAPPWLVEAYARSRLPRVAMDGLLAYGDSIAVGVRQAGGLAGNAVGGRTSDQVLAALQADAEKLRGRQIILSTGASNDLNTNLGFQPQNIRKQLDILKGVGAKVVVLGVGSGVRDFGRVNAQLAQIAGDYGAPFTGELEETGGGRVHPRDYGPVLEHAQRAAAGSDVAPLLNRPPSHQVDVNVNGVPEGTRVSLREPEGGEQARVRVKTRYFANDGFLSYLRPAS